MKNLKDKLIKTLVVLNFIFICLLILLSGLEDKTADFAIKAVQTALFSLIGLISLIILNNKWMKKIEKHIDKLMEKNE